jgi:hypothetical protein
MSSELLFFPRSKHRLRHRRKITPPGKIEMRNFGALPLSYAAPKTDDWIRTSNLLIGNEVTHFYAMVAKIMRKEEARSV